MDNIKSFLDLNQFLPRTIQNYKYYLNNLNKFATSKQKKVEKLEYIDLLEYFKTANKAQSSKETELNCFKSFYKFLYECEIIKKNPILNLKLKKEKFTKDPEKLFLTELQIEKLIEDVEKDSISSNRLRNIAIIKLLLSSGYRSQELCDCNIGDLDLVNQELSILRKGNTRTEIIAFNEDAQKALKAYLETRRIWSDTQPLFISQRGKRLTRKGISYMLNKYGIKPHTLRKTCGNKIFEETGDIYTASSVLGHASVSTTQKYYVSCNNKNNFLKNRR